MKVDASRGRLYDAHKSLTHRWDDLEALWADAAKKDFEDQVWEPLNLMTADALRAIDRLGQIFAQMRLECEGGDSVMSIS